MNTLFTIPRKPYVLACSGGPDSMAAFTFLLKGKHDFIAGYFHHGTDHGDEALKLITEECKKYKVQLAVGHISGNKSKDESPEEYFRRERYQFLYSLGRTVITAHHLDDCVETWLFSAINGTAKLIPHRTDSCMRPFLNARKTEMVRFADENDVRYVIDLSNYVLSIPRNRIRHELLNSVLEINPGIHSMIRRKLEEKVKEDILKKDELGKAVESIIRRHPPIYNSSPEEEELYEGWFDPGT